MATAAIISTYALFGLGEAMLSPTVAPLVADLAPERMVGQYNSAFALVKQLALAVGPAVGGLMASGGLYGGYIVRWSASRWGSPRWRCRWAGGSPRRRTSRGRTPAPAPEWATAS